MQNISQCQSLCRAPSRDALQDSLQQTSHLELAAASSERSADIVITTEEADKVTLSVDSRIQALALACRENTESSSARSETRAELFGFDIEREIELSVQGELDEQERRDIRRVLKAVFKMVKNFLAGKYEGGMEAVPTFDGLGSISNVTAEFEARDAAAFVSTFSSLETAGPAAPNAPGLQRQTPPAPGQTSAAVPDQAPAARAVAPVGDGSGRTSAEAMSDRMVEAVRESGIDPSTVRKPVDDFFGRLMRRFLDEGPFGFRRILRLRAVMEAFGRKMEALADPEPQAPFKPAKPETGVLQSLNVAALEQAPPQTLCTVQKTAANAQVSIFEQRFSFRFEASADKSGRAAEGDISLNA